MSRSILISWVPPFSGTHFPRRWIRSRSWKAASGLPISKESRLRVANQPEISESAVVAGALISAGFECRFAHLVPFAELRWSWHQDPKLDSLTGAVRAASLLVGTRLELL